MGHGLGEGTPLSLVLGHIWEESLIFLFSLLLDVKSVMCVKQQREKVTLSKIIIAPTLGVGQQVRWRLGLP